MILVAALSATILANPGPLKIDKVRLGSSEFYKVVSRASEFPASEKNGVTLAVAESGRIAVAWQSRRQLEGSSGVYFREFDKFGLSVGTEVHASKETRFHEARPSVAFAKKPLVVFESAWRDDSGTGVFGKSVIPQSTKGDQSDVVLGSLSDGRILAVWSTQVSRKERRLAARILDASGSPVGQEFFVSGLKTGSELLPSVAVDKNGAVIAWQALNADGKPNGIWARRFQRGAVLGQAVQLTSSQAIEPSISKVGSKYALAWVEADSTGRHKVRAQLLGADLRAGIELPVATQIGHQNAPAIAGRADGAVALSWNLTNGDEPREIYLSVFERSGVASTASLKLHVGALSESAGKTRLAWTRTNGLAVAWSGDAGLGDSKAANLTLLTPVGTMPEAKVAELRNLASRAIVANEAKPVDGDEAIRFAKEAGPHEPPTYNPKAKLDPWSTEPIEDGATGFNAVVDTGWTPPDPHMAVGPNHVGVMTNGEIAFFLKTGQNTFRDEIENSFGFWGSVGATNFVFDPEIVYDADVERWFAMCCERGSDGRSYFLLAVSDDDDPNGSWFKYRIDVTNAGGGGDIDSPNISTDTNCVYLGADFFTPNQKYLVFILSKADLVAGDPTPTTRNHLITGTQSHGMPMMLDPGVPQYLIEHFEAVSNTTVRLHAINDPLGTPTRLTFTLNVPSYGRPEDPPQAGTSSRPETFDSRFWSCVYRNGSLWATHHINSARVVARWYEIKMNNWPNGGTPTLVQSGDIDPGGTVRTFFSSIAVDEAGNAAVLSARSSPTEPLSMFRAIRKVSDPLGTMPDQAVIQQATGPYTAGRWGDYSAVVVDPADNRTFWGHHEYALAGSWRTWVESFRPALVTEERPVEEIIPILAGPITGGLPQIAVQDGTFMSVAAAPVAPTVTFGNTVDYIATASVSNIAELDVRTVAKIGVGLGQATILMLNRQTMSYELIGSGNLNSNTFTSFTVSASGNASRFVDPTTRQMRMRMMYTLGSQPSTFRPPIHLDEIKFITRQ